MHHNAYPHRQHLQHKYEQEYNFSCHRVGNCDWSCSTQQRSIVVLLKQRWFSVILTLTIFTSVVTSFQLPALLNQKHFMYIPKTHVILHHSLPFPNNDANSQQQQPIDDNDNNENNYLDDNDVPSNDQPTDLNQFMKEQWKSQQPQNIFTTRKDVQQADYYSHKQQQRYDPLMGYTLEDLEKFAASSTSFTNRPKIPKYDTNMFPDELSTTTDTDGVYLDPNEYIQSSQRDIISMDDTVPFIDDDEITSERVTSSSSSSTTTPIRPLETTTDTRYKEVIQGYVETIISEPDTKSISSYTNGYNNMETETTTKDEYNPYFDRQPQQLPVDNPNFGYQRYDPNRNSRGSNSNNMNNDMNDLASLDELWTTITQLQAQQHQNDPEVSEAIHRQIFENEIGFHNQSQIFLESLTNTTMASKANVERRGRYYRTRQEQAIQSLNKQIEEFEAILFSQQMQQSNATNDDVLCQKCKCRLSEEEINNPASKEYNSEPICRICYMERLVSNSRRNDMDRIQQQRESTRGAGYATYSQTGAIPTNTRRYTTTLRTSIDAASPKVSTQVEPNNAMLPSPEMKDDQSIINHERYKLSNTTTVSEYNGEVVDDDNANNNLSKMLPEDTQHPYELADFENPSGSTNLIYPWVEVMDPDTEEIFYWNEETEEMRWEL